MTAVLVGGFLLATTVAGTGAAYAGQAVEGRQAVRAGNGLLGLACRSTPSVQSLLKTGTTRLALDPDCNLLGDTTPVVSPTQPTMPTPDVPGTDFEPVPGEVEPEAPVPTTDQPTSSATANPANPTTAPPKTEKPSNPRPAIPKPQRPVAVPERPAAHSLPQGGTRVHDKDHNSGGTPTSATTETDSPATVSPGGGGTGADDVPPTDLDAVTGGEPESTGDVLADQAPVQVREPVSAVRATSGESRPIGLLALIAMVCVVGVSVGLIRAFVSERASRTRVA